MGDVCTRNNKMQMRAGLENALNGNLSKLQALGQRRM